MEAFSKRISVKNLSCTCKTTSQKLFSFLCKKKKTNDQIADYRMIFNDLKIIIIMIIIMIMIMIIMIMILILLLLLLIIIIILII